MEKYELNKLYKELIIDKLKEFTNECNNNTDEDRELLLKWDEINIVLADGDNEKDMTLHIDYVKNDKRISGMFFLNICRDIPRIYNMYITIYNTDSSKYISIDNNELLNVVNIPELYKLILEAYEALCKRNFGLTFNNHKVIKLPIKALRSILKSNTDIFNLYDLSRPIKAYKIVIELDVKDPDRSTFKIEIEGSDNINYTKIAETVLDIPEVRNRLHVLGCKMTIEDMIDYLKYYTESEPDDINFDCYNSKTEIYSSIMDVSTHGKRLYENGDIELFEIYNCCLKIGLEERLNPKSFSIKVTKV